MVHQSCSSRLYCFIRTSFIPFTTTLHVAVWLKRLNGRGPTRLVTTNDEIRAAVTITLRYRPIAYCLCPVLNSSGPQIFLHHVNPSFSRHLFPLGLWRSPFRRYSNRLVQSSSPVMRPDRCVLWFLTKLVTRCWFQYARATTVFFIYLFISPISRRFIDEQNSPRIFLRTSFSDTSLTAAVAYDTARYCVRRDTLNIRLPRYGAVIGQNPNLSVFPALANQIGKCARK